MDYITGIEFGLLYSSIAGTLIFALAFAYLFRKNQDRYLKYFALYWLFSALTFIVAIAMYLNFNLPLIYLIMILLASIFLLKGAYDFGQQKFNIFWYYLAAFIAATSIIVSFWHNWRLAVVITLIYLALAYVKAGFIFLADSNSSLLKATGVAALIFAANTFAYPFIASEGRFYLLNNSFLMGAGTFIGLSLIALHYENLKSKVQKIKDRYEKVVETQEEMICRFERDTTLTFVNKAYCENLGEKEEKLLGRKFAEFLSEADIYFVKNQLRKAENNAEKVSFEHQFKVQGEELKYQRWTIQPELSETGEVIEFQAVGRDIKKEREMERALKIKEEQYRKIFETAPIGIILEDGLGNILEVNDSFCEMSGYDKEELIGSNVLDFLVPEKYKDKAHHNIRRILAGERLEYTGTSINKWGEKYYVHFNETRVSLPQGGKGILSLQRDVTELKEKEEKLKYLSYHDDLTGLYNRYYLQEEMRRLNTKRQLPHSLIMADVNGLKIVNDTYGHEHGDEFLCRVAEILQDNIREEDLVARWAGDEFVVLLPKTNEEEAQEIANRIEAACCQEIYQDIPIALGIGIGVKHDLKEDFAEVLARADKKMYRDKLKKAKQVESKLVQNILATLADISGETKEHALRLTQLGYKLGEKIGLANEQLNKLSLLTTIHDIGKVTVPEEILTKAGSLSREEWELIKQHPEKSYTIASATEKYSPLARALLHHHERWDGRGYPAGLKEDEIPLLARILTIVDAFEVMTAGRLYREAVSEEEALQEIKQNSGQQFDPRLVEEFFEIFKEERE